MSKYQSAETYLRFSFVIIFTLLLYLNGCERQENPVQSNNGNGIPPAVPTRLNIYYAQDGAIGLEWYPNNEPDIKGYNVYRKITSGAYSLLGFTGNYYFIDDSLSYSNTYFYEVSAINNNNQESQRSSEVSATPVNKNPPAIPNGLKINARNWEGAKSIYLSWKANPESDVAGYNIYRDTVQNFTPDSTKLVGFSASIEYSDTLDISFYTNYYYYIKAIDKGGLISGRSSEVNDQVYEIAQPVFPADDSYPGYFTSFKIKTIGVPANYDIIVQTNKYFGDFWAKSFNSTIINDTIYVTFDPPYLSSNQSYYWRVITYSGNSESPNSISQQFKFTVK